MSERDRPATEDEIEVTPQMVKAGMEKYRSLSRDYFSDEFIIAEVYIKMRYEYYEEKRLTVAKS